MIVLDWLLTHKEISVPLALVVVNLLLKATVYRLGAYYVRESAKRVGMELSLAGPRRK